MSNKPKVRMKASTPLMRPLSERAELAQSKCACGGSPGIFGECDECRTRRLTPQRHTAIGFSRTQSFIQRAVSAEAGFGSALPPPEPEVAARPEKTTAAAFIAEDDAREIESGQMRK